eukprot:Opistho-1_new@6253
MQPCDIEGRNATPQQQPRRRRSQDAGRDAGNRWASTLKLGVVRLGKLCGKHKFMVVDAQDISFVRQFAFQARLELDRDGTGARIIAYGYVASPSGDECVPPVAVLPIHFPTEGPFHELLWQYHHGPIPRGLTIRHKNLVSVDNRLVNLELVPCEMSHLLWNRRAQGADGDASVYVAALNQLQFQDDPDECGAGGYNVYPSVALDSNGDAFLETGDAALFYECHNMACTKMESEIREFHLCGRCRTARYCGSGCQQMDWSRHRLECVQFRGNNDASVPSAR